MRFKKGEIVVSKKVGEHTNPSCRVLNSLHKITGVGPNHVNYTTLREGITTCRRPNDFRLATEKEARAYDRGIRHLKNIKEENYLIY